MTNGLNGIDLDSIDLATLKKLADAASEKFRVRKQGELKSLVSGWLAEAREIGYSVEDVMAEIKNSGSSAAGKRGRAPRADKGSVTPPKYRGPNGELWSGRGQPPNWMKPFLAAGKAKEDFLIARN